MNLEQIISNINIEAKKAISKADSFHIKSDEHNHYLQFGHFLECLVDNIKIDHKITKEVKVIEQIDKMKTKYNQSFITEAKERLKAHMS